GVELGEPGLDGSLIERVVLAQEFASRDDEHGVEGRVGVVDYDVVAGVIRYSIVNQLLPVRLISSTSTHDDGNSAVRKPYGSRANRELSGHFASFRRGSHYNRCNTYEQKYIALVKAQNVEGV